MERRIVTQLMTSLDKSYHYFDGSINAEIDTEISAKKFDYILVIGATNRPDSIDPALLRRGRFDLEISLDIPGESARVEILSAITKDLRLEGTFDLRKIARMTSGYVGTDLAALADNAGTFAVNRFIDGKKPELSTELWSTESKHCWKPEEFEGLSITMADFEDAIKVVQPSLRREGFSSIPDVSWEDVGGLTSLRKEFDRYIIRRIKYPEDYAEFGVDLETGILLYGPPGCGKTLIAKALAKEADASFIHVKGPELLNKYVGESELAVRTIFKRARACAPCIIFFDEVDALTTERGKDGGWVIERLLNQLLVELDGADKRKGVVVIGATNRLEAIDSAMLRPGRLGKILYVPLPCPKDRVSILKALVRKKPIAADVDLEVIGLSDLCNNFSGADLAHVVHEAAMTALEDKLEATECDDITVAMSKTIRAVHFQKALEKVSPSITLEQKRHYEASFQNFLMA